MTNLSDLLGLNDRKRDATTNGGEWHGPCPVCGGTDRCSYWPNHPRGRGGRWYCRRCTGGGDAVDYLQATGYKFVDAWRLIAGDEPLPTPASRSVPLTPVYASAPPARWQQQARAVVDQCAGVLFTPAGREALAYLRDRGLTDDTIRSARLGFNARGQYLPGHADAWLPAGVVIPCEVEGVLWSVKIRRLPTQHLRCPNGKCAEWRTGPGDCPKCGAKVARYSQLTGGIPALFGADSLAGAGAGVFVGGEFDALLLAQQARSRVGVITWGSESGLTRLDQLAPFIDLLLQVPIFLAVYDRDPAGVRGTEILQSLSDRIHRAELPLGDGKDITDLHLAGVDLGAWLEEALAPWERAQWTYDKALTNVESDATSKAPLGPVNGKSPLSHIGRPETTQTPPLPGATVVPRAELGRVGAIEANRLAWQLIESVPGYLPGESLNRQPDPVESAFYAEFDRLMAARPLETGSEAGFDPPFHPTMVGLSPGDVSGY